MSLGKFAQGSFSTKFKWTLHFSFLKIKDNMCSYRNNSDLF